VSVDETLRGALRPLARTARDLRGAGRAVAAYFGGVPADDDLRVWYGHPRIPRHDEPAVGGIVKLQGLQREFPDSPGRFNLLYLVTSRLPDGAVHLARSAHLKSAKVVVNQNGVAYAAWHGPGWERVNAPMAKLLPVADHVFYQSEFCRRSANRFLGERRGPSEILYNAVDTRRFTPSPDARVDRPVTLLLGGSQDAWYRVSTAVQVLACVRRVHADARLIVTGRLRWDGGEAHSRRMTEQHARDLGVFGHVTLVGPYTQLDAPAIFRSADVLLHTKYNDPCPTVVIEALASGLPVAYSASGGVPELVGPDAGLGVPTEASWDRDHPPDPELMARGVLDILANRARFAAAARDRAVSHFDLEPWIRRHRQVFEGLVA
jgi:glycosyltransferase involved in cell wall biosynthesis